jgi:hypothetical protein
MLKIEEKFSSLKLQRIFYLFIIGIFELDFHNLKCQQSS